MLGFLLVIYLVAIILYIERAYEVLVSTKNTSFWMIFLIFCASFILAPVFFIFLTTNKVKELSSND